MKKAIIIGNGPNWNYETFSDLKYYIQKNFNKIVGKIKAIDPDYANEITQWSLKIDFESSNFEKSLEPLDEILTQFIVFTTLHKLKNFKDDGIDHGSLSLEEMDAYLETENGKILMDYFVSLQDNSIIITKTIYQISVLLALFNDKKVNSFLYSNAFKNFLSEFDFIFTLNYDQNIERLGIENIVHLHGEINKPFVEVGDHAWEERVNKRWTAKNKHILELLSKEDYFLSSSLIESSAKRKQITLNFMNEVSTISNQLYSHTGRRWSYPNNYCELLKYDQIFIYGVSIENDEFLIDFLKENNKEIFYFFRDNSEHQQALDLDINPIKNPPITFN